MIKTKQIKSITAKLPKDTKGCVYANVLTWHDASHVNGSKYHVFSPYFLKTDGQETQFNEGNVLFENFWQGSKLWPVIYDCEIWAHPNLRGHSKHLWFKYTCSNGLGYERHLVDDVVQLEYYKWREAIFKCKKPIRYPNGFIRKSQVAFSLLINEDGTEKRLDYIEARKNIYINEYCRLIRKLPEFDSLKKYLEQDDVTLTICEIDVPDNETMSIEKLENLANNKNITFGHGLCLAWELLKSLIEE